MTATDGRFERGPDPRRHRFTQAERRRGWEGLLRRLARLPPLDAARLLRAVWPKVWRTLRRRLCSPGGCRRIQRLLTEAHYAVRITPDA